jgi:hypothetical protein
VIAGRRGEPVSFFGGTGKSSKVLRLIDYLDTRGHFEYILAAVRAQRGKVI